MVTLLIIALASAGVAVVLVLRGAALPRMRAEDSLGQIEAYGYNQVDAAGAPEGTQALIPAFAERIGARLGGQDAEARRAEARKLLLTAGIWDVTPTTLLGYRVLSGVVTAGVCAWLVSNAGVSVALTIRGGGSRLRHESSTWKDRLAIDSRPLH